MGTRRTPRFVVGFLLGSASLFATAMPVAAECTQIDPWPSFTEAAPTATRIVVGEVVRSYLDDSADNAIHFRVRVDEVLRGSPQSALEFREEVRSGAPLKVCPGDSILRVRVGDVLAFAFDARISSSREPVLAVAWVRGRPHDFLMPGAERLTVSRIRELARMPTTDTSTPRPRDDSGDLSVTVLLGLFAASTLLVIRRRRPHP